MHRVCGRAQTSTDGGRRAPFALGDDDERVTRGLRIEGLAAALACALTRGSLSADRLPPPPSSARTARTCRPRTTCTETVAARTAVAVATEAPVSTSRRTMRTEEDERGGRGRAAPTALACMRRAHGGWRGRANGEARGLARGGAMRDGWARQGAVLARRRRWRTSWSSWHRRGAATRPHSTTP